MRKENRTNSCIQAHIGWLQVKYTKNFQFGQREVLSKGEAYLC